MSENIPDLTGVFHDKDSEFSGGTGKPCGLEHEELKFPVPLESVGTVARYLELEAPLCGPADGVTAGFSNCRCNDDV